MGPSVLTLININPNKLGALEEYALGLSSELIRRGNFAAVGFSDYPPPWLAQRFNSAEIKVLKFNYERGKIRFIRDLRKAIKKYEINILHATFYNIYSPVLIAATVGTSCRLIYSDQVSRIPGHRRKSILRSIFRFLKGRLCQKFIHAIIADAKFIKRCQMQDNFARPDKIKIIYNGVNLERFGDLGSSKREDILPAFGISPEPSVIVAIAQCIPWKGLNYLLEAAAIVVKERPNTTFIIIGDGPERVPLEKQADGLALKDNCIFTGNRVDTELFLGVADIFVLLSTWEEAFAFSLLEGMASGCPVVATRIGAIPESVVEGLTGILVPPHDALATADALLKLLKNDQLRLKMGREARKRVETHFSLDQWINQTIDVYEKALY
ncbi:MAG: glycosyltransferase family 4 protein [Thermodesulfobacteriota bacterium]|nr:glycosyltransferase family 4 protein [Thermodesulfobacteriota bacterium]